MKKKFGNLKFDDVTISRYSDVKESIESIMNFIDLTEVEKHGSDVVLAEILKVIEENSNKSVEDRLTEIKNILNENSILKDCFSIENKEKVAKILSETKFDSSEEKFIYTINFYIPNDKEFIEIYSNGKKNSTDAFEEISKIYKLEDNQINRRLFQGRVMEIATFYQQYKEEKYKRRVAAENIALSAMKDAKENPTVENVDNVKELIEKLPFGNVKTSLEGELQELEGRVDRNEVNDNMNEGNYTQNNESEDIQIEVPVEETTEDNVYDDDEKNILIDTENLSQNNGEEVEIEDVDSVENTETVNDTVEIEENGEETHEVVEEQEQVNENSEVENENIPQEETTSIQDAEPIIGQEVLSAIQKMVVDTKEKKAWVKELEIKVESKDRQIAELERKIEAQIIELNNNTTLIQEKTSEISELKQREEEFTQKLNDADRIISTNEATIAELNKQINVLNTTLEGYKHSLTDIKKFLDAQAAE